MNTTTKVPSLSSMITALRELDGEPILTLEGVKGTDYKLPRGANAAHIKDALGMDGSEDFMEGAQAGVLARFLESGVDGFASPKEMVNKFNKAAREEASSWHQVISD